MAQPLGAKLLGAEIQKRVDEGPLPTRLPSPGVGNPEVRSVLLKPSPGKDDEPLTEIDSVRHDPKSPLRCPDHNIGGEKPIGSTNIEEISIPV
jgi:hypothetical protein